MTSKPPAPPDDAHYGLVAKAIQSGSVVPFLGAGANLCERTDQTIWNGKSSAFLPNGVELSQYLAERFQCTLDDKTNLLRVSQFVEIFLGKGDLYLALMELFNRDYPPTLVHRFLAQWPQLLRSEPRKPFPLVVTTNYDDLLEQAFREAGEPFDLVTYLAHGRNKGKFLHVEPGGRHTVIERPNEYVGVSTKVRSVILKIHGAVDRGGGGNDSFVITEDHYIDYLARADLSGLIPVTLLATLRRCHFLFLGYSLRDWNLRVILRRIAEDWDDLDWMSWAVQQDPGDLDQRFWQHHNVELVDRDLEGYVAGLREKFHTMNPDAADG